MKFLLTFFSKESLYKRIHELEIPKHDAESSAMVAKRVYDKVPEFRDFLKKRELVLLKSLALQDKPQLVTLGQINEVRFLLSLDTMPKLATVAPTEEVQPRKLRPMEEYLRELNKDVPTPKA